MNLCPECEHVRTAGRDPLRWVLRLLGRQPRARCAVLVDDVSGLGSPPCGRGHVWHGS